MPTAPSCRRAGVRRAAAGRAGGRRCWPLRHRTCVRSEQHYERNTAIVVTTLYDRRGAAIEITDFAPRFKQFGALLPPRDAGAQCRAAGRQPRASRVRLRPQPRLGRRQPATPSAATTCATSCPEFTLRLTTDIRSPRCWTRTLRARRADHLMLGPGRDGERAVAARRRRFSRDPRLLATDWVRSLGDSLRMAGRGDPRRHHAQALRLRRHRRHHRRADHLAARGPGSGATGTTATAGCAMPTSSSGAQPSRRHETMEAICATSSTSSPNATTAICSRSTASAASRMTERVVDSLPGYRGMGRCGSATRPSSRSRTTSTARPSWPPQSFFDERLRHPGTRPLRAPGATRRAAPREVLRPARRRACGSTAHAQRVHTFSAVMCWAACDRLARIAGQLGLTERALTGGARPIT
jgi:hypothetical protein